MDDVRPTSNGQHGEYSTAPQPRVGDIGYRRGVKRRRKPSSDLEDRQIPNFKYVRRNQAASGSTPRDRYPSSRKRQRNTEYQPREASGNTYPRRQKEGSERSARRDRKPSSDQPKSIERKCILSDKPVHGKAPQGARQYQIGIQKLSDMRSENTTEMLKKLICDSSGFPMLLKAVDISSDVVELAIAVMAKACACKTSPDQVVQLLNMLRTSNFLTRHVIGMLKLASLPNGSCIRDMLTLFREFLARMPSGNHVNMQLSFDAMERVVVSLRKQSHTSPASQPTEVDESIDAFWTEMNSIKSEISNLDATTTVSVNETQADYVNPAESFRTLSICPTLADIHFHGKVFLRENKISGAYQNLDHYLDVQFRLLREDFMSPLRDGFREYMAARSDVRHYNDIRVYTNVQVIEPVCSNKGVALRVQFDVSRLKKIDWATSERLIYGSMVCLSKDGFHNAFFATVHASDAKGLAQGEVSLGFENIHGLPDTTPEERYVIIENTAYFEAYRHVLQGLQSIHEPDLPFQKYIVYGEVEMHPPAYLGGTKDVMYDLSCLVQGSTLQNKEDATEQMLRTSDREQHRRGTEAAETDQALPAEEVDTRGSQSLSSVPVLQLQRWPSNAMLGLNAGQRRAVQAALTRELAVIQGPPGTGKTYIGLKVVQTLLANRHIWNSSEIENQTNPSPILVVCNTNHALDQFLEGIYDFQKTGIVRVGGRSKSKITDKFSLEKHRRASPRRNRQNSKQLYNNMNMWARLIKNVPYPFEWTSSRRRMGHLRDMLSDYTRQHQMAADRLKEDHEQIDLRIMRHASVLGMTTTGAAKHRRLLQELRPKIIIVEEAAEVLESHIVTAINGSCEHLILIGDHQQLRPNPKVYTLARRYNLNISLFERMVSNGVPCEMLGYQHRMRPEISMLLRHIYPSLRDDPCVLERGQVKGVSRNVFFLQHAQKEQHEGMSYRNEHEASFVVALCRYLLQQEHRPEHITVLTTYRGQLLELRKQLLNYKTNFNGVRVCVVDNYQGEENDIILLSLVRSNDEGRIGFLVEDNRVCVALSRARVGFYVVGNFRMFARKSKLWAALVKSLDSTGSIGETLGLYCQNHPGDKRLSVSTVADFKGAPDGGCLQPCGAHLQCSHVCVLSCHPYDTNHEEYLCQMPCTKVCHLGHVCPGRCYETCRDCGVLLDKVIPSCGHTQKVRCHMDPAGFRCLLPCEYSLPCGHTCTEICVDPHTVFCLHKVQRQFPCGHTVSTPCHNRTKCPQPCKTILSCGHRCSGTCSTCHRGRLHVPCSKRCRRMLVCGHFCSDVCSATCPPCSHKCENRCKHSVCTRLCGEACRPCVEPCAWRCRHYQCSKLCHEQCDRPRCAHRCKERLVCGHRCIGMCGEPCPNMCRVCNQEQFCQIFFGREDDPRARFVLLEDCRHVLEVEGLDLWMEQSEHLTEGAVEIQLKCCPKCNTPVRRSRHYGTIVKRTLADLEEVKTRIIDDEANIEATTQSVRKTLTTVEHLLRICRPGGENSDDARNRTEKIYLMTIGIRKMMERMHGIRLSLEEATCLENIANLLYMLWTFRETATGVEGHELVKEIDVLLDWALMSRRRLTEHEQSDMSRETQRLTLQVTAAKLTPLVRQANGNVSQSLVTDFDVTVQLLTSGSCLSEQQLETVESTLQEVRKVVVDGPLSDIEKLQVIKAVGITKGHWFKCRNGHIYAIGEWGGGVEKTKCPDCQATKGGNPG